MRTYSRPSRAVVHPSGPNPAHGPARRQRSGDTDLTIRDVFIRIKRFAVKLSPQELRHAKEDPNGKFARFAAFAPPLLAALLPPDPCRLDLSLAISSLPRSN